MITQSELKEILHYYPETGLFTWKVGNSEKYGSVAGYIIDSGYVVIRIHKKRYRAHRLAWVYVHGLWPKDEIDHVNRIKSDNRILNLREANRSQNNANRKFKQNSSSKYLGVCWNKHANKWMAQISKDCKVKNLGCFISEKDAAIAYNKAAIELHGEFARLNLHTN